MNASSMRNEREGAILGLVLVVMVIAMMLGAGLVRLAMSMGMEAGQSIAEVQAFWNAEAGAERARALAQKWKRPLPYIPFATSPSGFLWGTNALSGSATSGSYAVDIMNDPTWTNGTSALQRYIIRSRGYAADGTLRVVSWRSMIQSYASYMHASNYEFDPTRGNIYFGPGDVIDGPVYVNDELNVAGNPGPTFLQQVSSASNTVNYQSGATSNVFQGGLRLGADQLDISGQFSQEHVTELAQEAAAAGAAGLVLTGDHELNFNSNGSVDYKQVGGTTTTRVWLSTLTAPIYVNGDAWVNGQVNGRVTVAAQDSIYVSNSITYASAQSPNPWNTNFIPANVTDMLGLVASNQLQIVGTNAVTIHAAIMVTSDGGGFNASNRYVAIGQPPINLYGSMTQFRRGIVGQMTSPPRGYRKNYKFDTRFHSDAPPSFPYSLYAFSDWRQSSE